MEKPLYTTNYKVAVHWLGNHYILCNEIPDIDESIYENLDWDLLRDPDEDSDEYPECPDIYQFFISDCSQDQVEYLKEHFGILFSYSEKLGLYILCVTHYGTAWDYVYNDTDLKGAERKLGEKK